MTSSEFFKRHAPLRHKAKDIRYDNTSSGIAATTLQGALDVLFNLGGSTGVQPDRELIETIEAVGGEESVTFSGIDSDSDGVYVLEIQFQDNLAQLSGTRPRLFINGDTTDSNYSCVRHRNLRGSTHDVTSFSAPYLGWTENTAADTGMLTAYIQHTVAGFVAYNSDFVASMDNNANGYLGSFIGKHNVSTTNITSMTIATYIAGESFKAGSKFSLYKVRKP